MRRSWGQTWRALGRSDRFCDVVYLCDSEVKRSQALAGAISVATGLEVREGLPRFKAGDLAPGVCGVVGLSNPFSDADLDRLRELKELCPIIAVYAETAASLGLGRRCEVFLAFQRRPAFSVFRPADHFCAAQQNQPGDYGSLEFRRQTPCVAARLQSLGGRR